ncbi:MAG: T9SS type A sorting domain-containing protein [Ignavibacteriae bacterium]|nr:T9SS type A sorting domain-containing protein [Ignavibacteriota bacterium]
MLIPIITNSPNSPTLFYVTGGTWRRTNASGQDSIVVSLGNSPYYYEQRSGGAGEDINPVISGGVLTGDWRWRFWSVWESYVAGRWRLFGSWVKVSIGDVKEGGVVNAFQLEQNYPNPFNPTTTIRFTIPVGTGHAPSLLKVYDVLGREVTTLVNEAKEPGDHQITFNAEGLSSGVYLYKLQVGNFVAVRKLIVLR